MTFWLVTAAVSGFLSVAIGAFAAHGLEGRLPPEALDWLATGLRYQMLHVAGLLTVALLAARAPARSLTLAGSGFLAGTVVFSGLLYVMALTGTRWLGMIVPIGGVSFLIGWAALACYALTRQDRGI
ncbi:DUF423 domain-containing protein [Algihabitans albus]|uniref:DUF423 domain-containing protein n=1 Tax=Algihabitans albus TaxID=2164067 RepID=UPI001ABC3ACB|nr:DUF423 domain-containing protein [Algihabitans albus]